MDVGYRFLNNSEDGILDLAGQSRKSSRLVVKRDAELASFLESLVRILPADAAGCESMGA